MAEEVERPPRLIIEDEFRVEDNTTTCDDCWEQQPKGSVMRMALPSYQTERKQDFQSLDGRNLSIDLRMKMCTKCVVLNDLRRERRSNKPDPVATSKPAYADMLKKKTPVRKKK